MLLLNDLCINRVCVCVDVNWKFHPILRLKCVLVLLLDGYCLGEFLTGWFSHLE